MIKMSLAFSNPNEKFDYLRRLMKYVVDQPNDINTLRKKGFTLREIELLTGISKSQVSRELKESD